VFSLQAFSDSPDQVEAGVIIIERQVENVGDVLLGDDQRVPPGHRVPIANRKSVFILDDYFGVRVTERTSGHRVSLHRSGPMFETKLNIRQTDQMETEVGIAVFAWSSTCESSSQRSGRACQHPSKLRLNLWASLATSLTTTVFTPTARARAQKNNVRLIDGNELARMEKARQASGRNVSRSMASYNCTLFLYIVEFRAELTGQGGCGSGCGIFSAHVLIPSRDREEYTIPNWTSVFVGSVVTEVRWHDAAGRIVS